MAEATAMQAEEFGALLAQLEQTLGEYRKSYAAPEPAGPVPPMRPGMPTPPGWRPQAQDQSAPQQPQFGLERFVGMPLGALVALSEGPVARSIYGPGIDRIPQNPLTATMRAGYDTTINSQNALLAGLAAAGQTIESVSPAFGPAEAPLYGASKVLQAPAAAARAAVRSGSALAADLPHIARTTAQRATQATSDAASAVRNPLAAVAEDVKAGVQDARAAQLYRELEAAAKDYNALTASRGPMTQAEIERRAQIGQTVPRMASDYRRMTGEDLVPDVRGIGQYQIPELMGARSTGKPIINELMPTATRPQMRTNLLQHQPGPPTVRSGSMDLPDPRFIESPPGVWRRKGALPYEDDLDAQFRVMKGQQEIASPSRPPHPLGSVDPNAQPRDRLLEGLNRGDFSVDRILRSPNPRQALEEVAGRYGYIGEDGLKRFAGDLAVIGGRRAEIGIGRMVDRGPDNLFRTNPQWAEFDQIMRDARGVGRFNDPPTPRGGPLPEPVETPHGYRDPHSGQWTSAPTTARPAEVSGEETGFGKVPQNPLAKRRDR